MSDEVPAPPADPGPVPGAPTPTLRRPRKRFLVIGVVAAAALGVGLFTSLGSSSSGAPSAGDAVPAFSAPNVGPAGPSQVSVSPSSTGGRPTVLLFFGAWCPSCHTELPGLATAVASWVRGASFSTALGVAGRDAGDLAPGDFVRTMKSVADLAQQVSHTAADAAVAASAREAVDLLLRGVVAGGLPS